MKYFVILLVFSSMLLFAIPSVFAVPIEKVPITSFNAYSTNGKQIDKIMVGNQVILTADIENMQNKTQSFVYAIWIIDQNGKRTHEDWINATLDAKSSFTQSISWMPTDAGNYTVESSVWESIEHPTAFSAVWHINLEVMPKTSDTSSPLKQTQSGIPFNEIQCKQDLVLIQKYDGTPACVTESTKTKLIERGWTTKDDSVLSKINARCMTIEQSKQIAPFFKTPTYLPEGYSHVCSQSGTPFESYIVYYYQESPNQFRYLPVIDDAIFIYQYDSRRIGLDKELPSDSPEQHIQEIYDGVMKNNPSLNPQLITINGMLAYAVDSCPDCGMQIANFSDGTVIQKSTSTETKIEFMDENGVKYMLVTTLPLSELIKVAESLR